MIKKVYCPRIVFPLAPVLAALVDFGVTLLLLVPLMAWYGVVPSWPLVTLPLFVLLAMVTALAAGVWLAALSAMYRDFMYVVPFLTQFWLFVTPVVYETASVVPEKWRPLFFLNPMAGVVEGLRWSVFGSGSLPAMGLAISTGVVPLVLLSGLAYFPPHREHVGRLGLGDAPETGTGSEPMNATTGKWIDWEVPAPVLGSARGPQH